MTPVQHELFDPSSVGPAQCLICGALREAGQDKAPCKWEAEQREMGITSRYRPKACLNVYKPEHAEIPY